MVQLTIARLKSELHAAGVSPAQQNDLLARLRTKPATTAWDNLLRPLADSIRITKACIPKARPSRQPTYTAYLSLMQKTYASITYAQRNYETPDEAERAAAQTNATRMSEGKHPLGACRSHWSTWVPPHIVAATVQAFESMYASEAATKQPPGRRIHPFSTLTQRGTTQRKWSALLAQVQPHINAGYEIDPTYVEAHTRGMSPEQAEHIGQAMAKLHRERYRAAHAARKLIQQKKTSLTTDFIVPLHWTHVLDEDTRAHLRAAERAAGGDGYTRDVGIFHDAPLVPDAPGYVAPRPADRLTAAADAAAARQEQEQARVERARTDADAWLDEKISTGDL